MPSSASKRFHPTSLDGSSSFIYTLSLPPAPTLAPSKDEAHGGSNGMPAWRPWVPGLSHAVEFQGEVFETVMLELVSNPNYNSSLVMRADVVWDDDCGRSSGSSGDAPCKLGGYESRMAGEWEGEKNDTIPRRLQVRGYCLMRSLVRRIVPRNPAVDRYLFQSCLFYREDRTGNNGSNGDNDDIRDDGDVGLLVIYLPHASSVDEIPFYHPPVEGIAFMHKRSAYTPLSPQATSPTAAATASFTISIHHLPFPTTSANFTPNPNRLPRILHNLLCTLTKHGSGILGGYTKRVHHDQLIPRSALQDRYLHLKQTHAKRLMEGWVERTDPRKHVFEDLLIAAFLIEWWHEVYDLGDVSGRKHKQDGQGDNCVPSSRWQQQQPRRPWVGFVDIGCGNGVLVDILRREGWNGWGFDARRRKSWDVFLPATAFSSSSSSSSLWLREMLLIPSMLNSTQTIIKTDSDNPTTTTTTTTPIGAEIHIHQGIFPRHTFLISNHSDQLTGWTPLLAAQSDCPFLAIPCCSYNLSGEKFRARTQYIHNHNHNHNHNYNNSSSKATTAAERSQAPSQSAYATLCAWTEALAERVGWVVEKEVLRIPSTRNMGILGRWMQTNVRADVQDKEWLEGEEERGREQGGGGGGGGGGEEGDEGPVDEETVESKVLRVLDEEGGADGWVESCMGLVKGLDRQSFTH